MLFLFPFLRKDKTFRCSVVKKSPIIWFILWAERRRTEGVFYFFIVFMDEVQRNRNRVLQ